MTKQQDWEKAAQIVQDAGGKIVGRTKLQKVAYLLELAGWGDGFPFEYRHYGPYSEDLSDAIWAADAFGFVEETEKPTQWGGRYSVFISKGDYEAKVSRPRSEFAETLASIDSVELELAATAAYISAEEGLKDPWDETARRKPEKVGGGRLENAKNAYRKLLAFKTPITLPAI